MSVPTEQVQPPSPPPPAQTSPSPLTSSPSLEVYPAAAPSDSTTAASPPSPRLGPSSPPPGASHVSSLDVSFDANHPATAARPPTISELMASNSATIDASAAPSVAWEAHTLMQMLSVVGSRLLEADQLGLKAAQDPDDNGSSADDESMSSSLDLGDVPRPLAGPNSGEQIRRRPGIMSEVLDEQSTPVGGQTPLASSLHTKRSGQKQTPSRTPSRLGESFLDTDTGLDLQEPSRASSPESDDELADAAPHEAMAESLHSLSEGQTQPETQSASADAKAQLSQKLQNVFSLSAAEEVRSCYSCWIFRSVLLQGHLYLTDGHVLFYAYLPSRGDRVIKAGSLRKRTQKTYRFSRHWAVLRGRALSWYDNQRDPYFPQDHIDLRSISAVEPASRNPRHFKVHTPQRIYVFGVETQDSRDDWVQVIRKATFRAQNEGDSVRISIPLEAIVDVENTTSADQTDMVCLQVVDSGSQDFSLGEYYFLQFSRQADFVRDLKAVIGEQSGVSAARANLRTALHDSTGGIPKKSSLASLRDVPHLPSIDPRKEARRATTTIPSGSPSPEAASTLLPGAIAIPGPPRQHSRTMHEGVTGADDVSSAATPRPDGVLSQTLRPSASPHPWEYPPSPAQGPPPPGFEDAQTEPDHQWPVSRWVRRAPSLLLHGNAAGSAVSTLLSRQQGVIRPVVEIWSNRARLHQEEQTAEQSQDLTSSECSTYSVLEAPESDSDQDERNDQSDKHFRTTFSLPMEEELLCHLEASLYRVLPVTGRLYVTSHHLCFRSSTFATKTIGRTKMILPFAEVLSCTTHRAFRLGQYGLVITIRGHEEVFLEVASLQVREQCIRMIEKQIELGRQRGAAKSSDSAQRERDDALVLTDLMAQANRLDVDDSVSSLDSSVSGSTSQEMSLLSLRPKETLHFTILTIGSRGDVQPYVALAKGLLAEGHRVRIATHAEFGPWIEQHGAEFCEIGGDPAELMRICVENGTFTVAFLREGVTKFRGWLDDLLVSCWQACQGTDVIIESPNAIAGIHISEALQVPYYRSFTMPWSRTRAYPQAFAVPNKKAGGNYNYMTYVIFDQVLWTASSGQVNRWRRNCLGLQPTSLDRLQQHKTPFLYNFSPSLVPKPLDWYDWIHVTGFWFLDNSMGSQWDPPQDLVAFLEASRKAERKVVYIGWGSITVPDAVATTRCVVEAVQRAGVRAILSKGWSDRLSKSKGSTNDVAMTDDIFQVNSVPHDWLFPLIDAACHHGGAGTLGASLRAGIPTIVKPFFGDQFFWGQQVENLGVGSCVKDLIVENLAAALRTATQDTKQIERARALGKQIRAESGVAEAIRAIYADLEYARSLIKRDSRVSGVAAPSSAVPLARTSAIGRHRADSTAASSPSNVSSPSGLRSFSPDTRAPTTAALKYHTLLSQATTSTSATPAQGEPDSEAADRAQQRSTGSRHRADSAQTTSDEWSVVSGDDGGNVSSREEDDRAQ